MIRAPLAASQHLLTKRTHTHIVHSDAPLLFTTKMRLPSWVSYIPKKWHVPPKAMYTIFAIEVAVSVPALALYGIAKPDTYRTRLWQEGYNQGWNSDPKEVLYAYANSRPIPDPLPWSQLYVFSITCLLNGVDRSLSGLNLRKALTKSIAPRPFPSSSRSSLSSSNSSKESCSFVVCSTLFLLSSFMPP